MVRFTPARLNRKNRTDFPSMGSKAIQGKVMTFWLCDVAVKFAEREGATDLDRLVAACIHTYADVLKMMDEFPLLLSEEQAEKIFSVGQVHLLSYARLRKLSHEATGWQSLNRSMWLLLPKHHHMMHMLETTRETRVNPRFYTLLCGESFMGIISRMGRLVHRSTVSKRVAERYLAKLGLFIRTRYALDESCTGKKTYGNAALMDWNAVMKWASQSMLYHLAPTNHRGPPHEGSKGLGAHWNINWWARGHFEVPRRVWIHRASIYSFFFIHSSKNLATIHLLVPLKSYTLW